IGVPNVANAHGDGSIIVGRSRLDARQFTLSGSIYYPSRQAIRDAADTLLSFLQYPPIEVFKWPAPDDRRLFCWPQGAAQGWMGAGAEFVSDIPMLAPDPYWYGAEVVETETDADGWSTDVTGNAPALPVVTFSLSASGTSIELLGPAGTIELDGGYQ